MNAPVTITLPTMRRDAQLRAASFNDADNTVEIVWTTGARVRRRSWYDGEYDEALEVTPKAVRLDRLNAGAPFLNTHASFDLADVIGSVVPGSAKIVGGKGVARVLLSDAPADADVVTKIRSGVIKNISVGYRIHAVVKEERDGDVPLHTVTDWEPLEVSAVPIPADAGAQIRAEGARTFPATITHRSKQEAKMPNPNTTTASNDAATLDAVRASNDVIEELATRCGMVAFGREHIAAGTPVEEFRRLLVTRLAEDDRRSGGHIAHVGTPIYATARDDSRETARAAAIENALLHRSDPLAFPLDERAGGRDFVGMPLLEIARHTLEARGVRTTGMGRVTLAGEALAQRSFGGLHTTSDFPAVLANVANKSLRASYEAAPQTFRPLVRIVTVPDFKEVSRTQLGEAPQFEKVNEHGEFKRGTMGEAAEKYRVETYGRVVSVTRQVIVNDDLGAFTRVPRAFGIQAAQLESDLVWSEILRNAAMGDNVALFHNSHANLLTAGAIGETTVSEARLKMSKQTGLDGKTVLNLSPEFLITPKALETAALKFVTTITPAKTEDVVPQALRTMTIISEPRLDTGIARYNLAGSASNYYFAANPATIDLIELAYLEGAQGVYTETRMGFDVDGVEIKARMDVGAKAIDWRGFSKNPYAGS